MICHSPTAAPSSFAQSYDDQFLPPKKRQALGNHDDAISRGGFEGSTTIINKKKEQDVLLTSAKGKKFQTPQYCKEPAASNQSIEEKKINEGETKLGSKVVKNFDLDELPSDDMKNFDLNELPSDDAKNFDLNEYPIDDVKNFDLNKLPSDDVKNFDLNEYPIDDVKNFDSNVLPRNNFEDEDI
ncbi:hypothetical protein MTR_1g063140 [Medicago truncatula]|uniref:Uncharacterized protein n=1 Tax=Medicago truncatula TaxID=3880 RepID=A0A072VJF8_MEDTR|nr:hypothetical protein MTR_1g063140 [Medicago truncatula]